MRAVTLLLLASLLLVAAQSIAEEQPGAGSAMPSIFADHELKTKKSPSLGPQSFAAQQIAQCCKICRKGKACGNSCIRKSYTCHKPPGCACDGN